MGMQIDCTRRSFYRGRNKKTGASERVFTDADRRFSKAPDFYKNIVTKEFNVNKEFTKTLKEPLLTSHTGGKELKHSAVR